MRNSKNKLVSMGEAISECVKDGDSIVIDGFTHLICFAAGHEIIRQGRKNLSAIRLTPDLIYDQLIQGGCVSKLVFSWAGNPGVGSLHAFRRKTGKGNPPGEPLLVLEEYSHFGMVGRFLAGSSGLPFWVLNNYYGTDLPQVNPHIRFVECPYSGQKFATVPAIHPDVTIVHTQRADQFGNAQVWGLLGTQKEAAFSAKKVIVVTEEVVETSVIRSDPNRTLIPGLIVDCVVHEPWGCHPSYVQGYYDRDNAFYVQWEEISKKPETYQDYLHEFVFGVANRNEYLKKLSRDIIEKLTAKSKVCSGVDYGY